MVSKEVDSRSLYVRPFPMDTTVDNLLTFFGAKAEVRWGGCAWEEAVHNILVFHLISSMHPL